MVSFFITTVLWQMRGISEKNDSNGPDFLVLYLQDRTKLSLFTIRFCTVYFGKHKNLLRKYNISYFIHQQVKISQKTSTFHLEKQVNQIKITWSFRDRHHTDKKTSLNVFKSLCSYHHSASSLCSRGPSMTVLHVQ